MGCGVCGIPSLSQNGTNLYTNKFHANLLIFFYYFDAFALGLLLTGRTEPASPFYGALRGFKI